ncbi:MAG: glycosyltransferase family 1 protein [Nitrospirae bacterium]|nr:MAG: glycosyltransferase family 1 protein [Nitrospirota bacterium]
MQARDHVPVHNRSEPLTVTHYHRRFDDSYSSIEGLFAEIRSGMPPFINCKIVVAPFVSRGFWRRLANIITAPFYQSDVNHITGDINYVSFLLSRKKTILTIHDCVVLERLSGLKKAIFFLFWYWLPEKRIGIITAVSHSTKKELLRYLHCDPEKIRVIHNCISADFKPQAKVFNATRPVLLQIGTRYNKNLIRVAEALRDIPCHLRIIGVLNREQSAALSRFNIDYSAKAGITGQEMVREYQDADMLVFVSTYEGFGLPVAEANAVGRPVVTSNLLSMPEVAGTAACLVDPYSVPDIRKGILSVLSDRDYREKLIADGYENAKRFNAAIIAGQYAGLYEEVYRNSF